MKASKVVNTPDQRAGRFSGACVQALLMQPVLDGGHGGQCDEDRALAHAHSTGQGRRAQRRDSRSPGRREHGGQA